MVTPDKDASLEFIVGSERALKDLLEPSDVRMFLQSILKAGALFAGITDADGSLLWTEGDSGQHENIPRSFLSLLRATKKASLCSEGEWLGAQFFSEGEPIGHFIVYANPLTDKVSSTCEVVLLSICLAVKHTTKRMLTTEVHTAAIQQSYEELLQTNRELMRSEQNYKELAQSLEQKVQERTEELKQAHIKLLQKEKMAAVGQLAAGTAHEINNPIGFIYSNLNSLKKYTHALKEMLSFYRELSKRVPDQYRVQEEELSRKLKIDFILGDIDALVSQSAEGAERVKQIVADMRGFSHIDEAANRMMDLTEELETTLRVLGHEIEEKGAKVTKEYRKLPPFFGNPGLVCQAFHNILVNALYSREFGLELTLRTETSGNKIFVSICDNGCGIPDAIITRIFEPFFTTREVGEGKGMGLAVAFDIISSHGGTIEVKSTPETGSCFTIILPAKS